jgi:hypothetical protein
LLTFDDLGSLDDGRKLFTYWRGFRMLPGGTLPIFSMHWKPAASLSRSGPLGGCGSRRPSRPKVSRTPFRTSGSRQHTAQMLPVI